MEPEKLLARGAERLQESDAMPSKADMIAAFGPECVVEIKDEAGEIKEVRYYYIRPGMSDEQKLKNWNLFNEMVAKARGLTIENSERRAAEKDAVRIVHPNGGIVRVGEAAENAAARKKGFRPVISWGRGRRYAYRNGVMVPVH